MLGSQVAFQHRAYYLGNHVARLVHHNGVALAHVLAAYLVNVVQRGTGNGRARHHDRVELRDRRQHARTPNLNTNLTQDRTLLFRRELVGDGPARRTCGKAEGVLLREGVDLDDHAVDVVVELVAMRQRLLAEVMNGLGIQAALRIEIDGKATVTQPLQELPLARHADRGHVGHGIDEGCQVAMGGDAWILLPEAACCRVAWIGKDGLARAVALLVETNERPLGHVDLTTDLNALSQALVGHACKTCRRQRARNIADGTHVGRDVFARGAVATRRRTDELAITIRERNTKTIDLELTRIGDRVLLGCSQRLIGACEPLVQLVQVHGVIHGVHALSMGDRLKLLGHVATHALGVGVGRHELGMRGLDGQQLLEETVKLGIGHLGRIERIVLVCGMVEQTTQLKCAKGRACRNLLRLGGLLTRKVAKQRHLTIVCHGILHPHACHKHTDCTRPMHAQRRDSNASEMSQARAEPSREKWARQRRLLCTVPVGEAPTRGRTRIRPI